MKAKLSVILDELRGKAGTVVGKLSNEGQIIMIRSVGADPKVQSQIRSRMLLTALATRWKTLTQAQRDAWNTAAGLKKSGYSLFCEYNTNLNSVNVAFKDDESSSKNFPTYFNLTIEVNIQAGIFNVKVADIETGKPVRVRLKISQFTDRLLSNDSYKYKNVNWMNANILTEKNIFDDIIRVNGGAPKENQWFKFGFDFVDYNSGASSTLNFNTYQWTNREQPYVPEFVMTQKTSGVYYDVNNDNGYIGVNFTVPNFVAGKAATYTTRMIIYNDQAATQQFYANTVSGQNTLVASGNINRELDGLIIEGYPWAAGVTKYFKTFVTVYVTAEGTSYEYVSAIYPITSQ